MGLCLQACFGTAERQCGLFETRTLQRGPKKVEENGPESCVWGGREREREREREKAEREGGQREREGGREATGERTKTTTKMFTKVKCVDIYVCVEIVLSDFFLTYNFCCG